MWSFVTDFFQFSLCFKSSHAIACMSISFIFIARQCHIVQREYIGFVQLSADGHSYFYILTTIIYLSMNIFVHIFVWVCIFTFLEYKLTNEWNFWVIWQFYSGCLSYFSIIVIRHHGKLQDKEFFGDLEFQGVSPWSAWWEGWQQTSRKASRHGHGSVVGNLQLGP